MTECDICGIEVFRTDPLTGGRGRLTFEVTTSVDGDQEGVVCLDCLRKALVQAMAERTVNASQVLRLES